MLARDPTPRQLEPERLSSGLLIIQSSLRSDEVSYSMTYCFESFPLTTRSDVDQRNRENTE